MYVPDSYDPGEPTPLVISLHAGATWPTQQMNLSGWNRLADEHGFLVVYPSGTPQLFDVVRIWRTFDRGPGLQRDVRFISDLIDTLQFSYNVDPARIYANGMSNGGGMAFVLACTLADRIAAAGTVAPAHSLPSDSWVGPTSNSMDATSRMWEFFRQHPLRRRLGVKRGILPVRGPARQITSQAALT